MSDKEIITRLARDVMGWTVIEFSADDRQEGRYPRLVQQFVQDRWWVDIGPDRHDEHREWSPLTDIHDAIEVQAKIAQKKRREYLLRLREIISTAPIVGTEKLWWGLVNATARQRCQAALAALDGATV